jgi:integrase
LEYGIRKKMLTANPFDGLEKNKTKKTRRLVTKGEMDLAVKTGRRLGGSRHIVAMALYTAWLCVKRPVEVRRITRDAIKEDGIQWVDGKDEDKAEVLIEWSPALKATITEALAIKRNHVAGTMYIFGNMQGQKYTKGGWKSMLDDLMRECIKDAAQQKIAFKKFNLQDCRPMGVSDKLERGDKDTKEATGHTSDKMISTVYDRRPVKRATPAG